MAGVVLLGCFGLFTLLILVCTAFPVTLVIVSHSRRIFGWRSLGRLTLLSFGVPAATAGALLASTTFIDWIARPPSSPIELVRCDARDPAVTKATVVFFNSTGRPILFEPDDATLFVEGRAQFPESIKAQIVDSSDGPQAIYIVPDGERLWLQLESRTTINVAGCKMCRCGVALSPEHRGERYVPNPITSYGHFMNVPQTLPPTTPPSPAPR